MKIVHIANIRSDYSEGISTVLDSLIPAQIKEGNDVFLLNIHDNENKKDYEFFIRNTGTFKELISCLNPNVVVFHSLYKFKYIWFSFLLRFYKIPYLIEPHGGMTEQNHKKSFLAKKIADIVFINRMIANAAGIIYLNEAEKKQCVFKKQRKCCSIIPNGIDIQKLDMVRRTNNNTVRFVYLSRVDFPQKAVDYLLDAWKLFKLNDKDAELHIYGKCSDVATEKKFNELTYDAPKVFYHGLVRGDAKTKAYTKADIFVLTSRYEGMPMSILEALSHGLPCLITQNTNMGDLIIKNNCGWVCKLSVESIAETISLAKKEYIQKRTKLSENAKVSVTPYQWNSVAKIAIKEYVKIINTSFSKEL